MVGKQRGQHTSNKEISFRNKTRRCSNELIAMFLSDEHVEKIYFNDSAIVEKYEKVKKIDTT
jgi:hypothetical protein